MIKKLIFLFALAAFCNAYSQKTEKDSVIHLAPVIVHGKPAKKKIITFEPDGYPAYNGLQHMKKMVCRLKTLPAGKIKSVTFYFNTGLINLLHKKLQINYKDVRLGIVIYDIAGNGLPGDVISDSEVQFMVKSDHRGSLEVNLEELNLSSKEMYIGLAVLSEISNTENNIYIRFNESDDTRSFIMSDSADEQWQDKWMGFLNYYFKMEIKVEQVN
jgi:hypothetical protein